MKKLFLLLTLFTFVFSAYVYAQKSWLIKGNAGTNIATDFIGTTDAKPLAFRTNNKEQFRIDKTGKIGIGTSTPGARLQIINQGYLSLKNPGYLVLGDLASLNLAFDVNTIQARYDSLATGLYLNYYGGSTFAGNATGSTYGISATGKIAGAYGYNSDSVGIGVYGKSNYYHGVLGSSDGGLTKQLVYAAGVYGYNSNTGYGVDGYSQDGIGVIGSSTNYIGVWGEGNVYAAYFDGSVYTTGTYLPSDPKLKKNISDLNSAMNIINELRPKKYEYRQDGAYKLMNLPAGNRYGLLADDVEKVLPGLVKETEFNSNYSRHLVRKDSTFSVDNAAEKNVKIDYKALNYSELIPIIIKGMQEQDKTIESLRQINDQQQQQIDQLKQLVQTLANNQSSISASALPKTGAYLLQNSPNPFNKTTTIRCNIPSSVKQAQLVVYSNDGKAVKTFSLNNVGVNEIKISAGSLQSGQYKYALIVDGQQVDSKSMTLTN